MPLVSESVANAKVNIDRLTSEIDGWAREFVELLDGVKHLDLVFSEAEGMDITYIALCDWARSRIADVSYPNDSSKCHQGTATNGTRNHERHHLCAFPAWPF